MGDDFRIEIHGLKPFIASLKRIDPKLPQMIRKVNNQAAQIVVLDARPHVPRVSGTARRSVKAQSTQREARVVGGGNQAPYYGWLDFGGWGGTNKKNYRPMMEMGRYIYASYFKLEDQFQGLMQTGLVRVVETSGLHVEVG